MPPVPLSALTTTNGFSLMPYSLYLRRILPSSASVLLRRHSSPCSSAKFTSPHWLNMGLMSQWSMPSSLPKRLDTSS
ncbi:hypothetical protein D3C87_2094160 [compost metagenome]